MKRLVLAGVLAVAGVLGSAGTAEASGFGGIAFGFGIRYSFWSDHGAGYACAPACCYAPPMVGGAAAFVGAHPWAHAGPFGHGATFVGYGYGHGHAAGSFGGHHVGAGYDGHVGHGGMMVGHSYGYGHGSWGGYGHGY